MSLRNVNETAADLPPEFCHYPDEGCELAESCLNCPLPVCVYDGPGAKRRLLKQQRALDIARRRAEGKTVRELSRTFGLSVRTVRRILQRLRQTAAPIKTNEREPDGCSINITSVHARNRGS